MPVFRFPSSALLVLSILCCSIVSAVRADDTGTIPVYRAYPVDSAKPYAASVAALEQKYHIVTPPGMLSGIAYKAYPEPFDIDLRRGRVALKIAVFVIVDSSGRAIQLYVVNASDATVARVAGAKLGKTKWLPSKLAGVPVTSAGIWEFEGAGLPN